MGTNTIYAILLKEFRHSMVLGKSNTKVSKKYCLVISLFQVHHRQVAQAFPKHFLLNLDLGFLQAIPK